MRSDVFSTQNGPAPEEPSRTSGARVVLVLLVVALAAAVVVIGGLVAGGLVLLAWLVGVPLALLLVLLASLL